MGRKTILAELIGGKGNRQRIWEAIRAVSMDEAWTLNAICLVADVDRETAASYIQGLAAAGYIAAVADVPANPDPSTGVSRHRGVVRGVRYYRLVRDTGVDAPRVNRKGSPVEQGLKQEQMWRTLRLMKTDCNAHELAAHATTSLAEVSAVAAHDYLRTLATAGYLDRTRDDGRESDRRYRLKASRNTGPRPPMVCRTSAVFDPNENRVVWQKPVNEETAIYGN